MQIIRIIKKTIYLLIIFVITCFLLQVILPKSYQIILRNKFVKIEIKFAHLFKISPRFISVIGKVNAPRSHIQISSPELTFAVVANQEGNFKIENVVWYPGIIYKIDIETSSSQHYQSEFLSPLLSIKKSFEISDIDIQKCTVASADKLEDFFSTHYQKYDSANDRFFQLLFDKITQNKSNEEEKLITISSYIAQKLRKKSPIDFNPTAFNILSNTDPHSYTCGQLANAMAMLLTSKNYKVRTIDIVHQSFVKKPDTHVLVEVFYNKAWHLFDPTYNIIYKNNNGEIINYVDLHLNPNLIMTPQFPGPVSKNISIELLQSMYGSGLHYIYIIQKDKVNN